jgi:acyl carrier protein
MAERVKPSELAEVLRQSMSKVCDIPADSIHDDSDLEQLGFDSLASAEVITDVEIRLGRELPVDALRRLTKAQTVQDVVLLLQRELATPSDVTTL